MLHDVENTIDNEEVEHLKDRPILKATRKRKQQKGRKGGKAAEKEQINTNEATGDAPLTPDNVSVTLKDILATTRDLSATQENIPVTLEDGSATTTDQCVSPENMSAIVDHITAITEDVPATSELSITPKVEDLVPPEDKSLTSECSQNVDMQNLNIETADGDTIMESSTTDIDFVEEEQCNTVMENTSLEKPVVDVKTEVEEKGGGGGGKGKEEEGEEEILITETNNTHVIPTNDVAIETAIEEATNDVAIEPAIHDANTEKDSCEMDLEATADDIIDCVQELPADGTMSPIWLNYMKSLTDSVKTIATLLREECSSNQKNMMEISDLKQHIEKLKHEITESRQWQNTVYIDMQNTIMHYQQYYHQLSYMYMGGYGHYPQAPAMHENEAAVIPNGFMPNVNDVNVNSVNVNSVNVNSVNVNGVATDVQPCNKNEKVKDVVTESAAVAYGDSVISKKLSERKRYRPKLKHTQDNNGSDVFNPIPVVRDSEESGDVNEISRDMETKPVFKSEISDDPTLVTMECTTTETNITTADTDITDNSLAGKDKTIEETLRETAESVVSKTGFQYDENSGQYYDWNLKMYYDPTTQLYFDHENGIYYYYDTEKNGYIFHAQVEMDKTTHSTSKVKTDNDSNPSEGEICSDNETDVRVDSCVRVIVVDSEAVDLGSLFVITCKGGTIGRDPTCLITIPEDVISRTHNYIIYDDEDKTFYIQDNKTQNGTFLNNERIADAKMPSEPVEITHRDFVKIGDTTMSFHVHIGRETCAQCEPGNIQAIIAQEEKYNDFLTREDMHNERKRQAKALRKKYGINPGYLPKSLLESIPDRAGVRRKEFGVEAYENKELPIVKASVVKEIPSDNKGHKMLAKMGWKSGEGLGKSGTGIVNPITVNKLGNSQGLGTGIKTSLDHVGDNRKQLNLAKTRQRYNQCD